MIIAYLISNPQFNIWNILYVTSQSLLYRRIIPSDWIDFIISQVPKILHSSKAHSEPEGFLNFTNRNGYNAWVQVMLLLFRINILTLSLRFPSSCLTASQDEISACIKLIHCQDKIVCQQLVSTGSFSHTFKLTADKLPLLFLLLTKPIKPLATPLLSHFFFAFYYW